MKPISRNTGLVGIGAILVLALAGMPIQNAEALDSTVLYKLQSIQNNIEALKENTQNFDANKIASQAFNFRITSESLLEIQNSQNLDAVDNDTIFTVVDYLITEYEEVFDEYKTQVEEYEKHNSVDMKQKLIMKKMIQNFIDFKNADEDFNKLVSANELIKSEIKRVENEAKFQAHINKIAIKIVDENNGNKVQKTYHEIALQKIAEEENWMLVAPAMDRIITQLSSPEAKQHLEMYKEKVLYSCENLEKSQLKQPEILTLTNDVGAKTTILDIVSKGDNEILTPSIVIAQLKDEIKSTIFDSQKIIEDENSRIGMYIESQRLDSQEDDKQDSIRKKLLASQSEPESEPEPEQESVLTDKEKKQAEKAKKKAEKEEKKKQKAEEKAKKKAEKEEKKKQKAEEKAAKKAAKKAKQNS